MIMNRSLLALIIIGIVVAFFIYNIHPIPYMSDYISEGILFVIVSIAIISWFYNNTEKKYLKNLCWIIGIVILIIFIFILLFLQFYIGFNP
jgi:zinc transporter ZupT